LERILGFELHLTNSKEDYLQSNLPKINYSYTPLANQEIYIIPQGLLFEQGVNSSLASILPLTPPSGDAYTSYCPPAEKADNRIILNEDILATSFFLLSRYEEYLPFQADTHGRFSASQSVAHRQGFLRRPLINEWAIELGNLIESLFTDVTYKRSQFKQFNTFDIDQAFKYKNKGFLRTLGAFAKNNSNNKERSEVLLGKKHDPFDVFSEIEKWHEGKSPELLFFILLGDHGEFDKNINFQNSDFQNIIRKIASKHQIGIHPSYRTNDLVNKKGVAQLLKEKMRLEKISNQKIEHSRQHFLKLRFPETYEALLSAGITHDYSMGYSDDIGFRASICSPFFWYDLSQEKTTNLMIHPFQVMDVTLKNYLKLRPEKAIIDIMQLKDNVKNVRGEFVLLWHNSSFDEEWKEWIEVYKKTIE
jgi:hypothetical protein